MRAFRSIALLLAVWLAAASAHAQPALMVYDFTLTMTPRGNIDYVKSLGYSGLVTRLKSSADLLKLKEYESYASRIDGFDLIAYVAFDFNDPASPLVWRDALPVLAKAGSPLWVVVKKAPSDAAIRQLLMQMARESQAFGVQTVVYPHWNTSIETADEAATHIAAVGHPNLLNSLHTAHEIRGGNQYDIEAVVAAHVAQTALVAIAGADHHAYAGPPLPFLNWSDVIKPLDEGGYSLLPFLQALQDAGYDGPVILQTFGIISNPGHLQRSIRRYGVYTAQLNSGGHQSETLAADPDWPIARTAR